MYERLPIFSIKEEYRCPACSSYNLKKRTMDCTIKEPFGTTITITGLTKMICLNDPCDCTGDFLNENEIKITLALRRN